MNAPDLYSKRKLLAFSLAAFSAFMLLSGASLAQTPLEALTGTAEEPTTPQIEFPDLSSCTRLKDPNAYTGDDRLVKFIHVGSDGWLYRSSDFRTDFTMPEKTMNYMKRVNDALKNKGVDLYLALQPPRAMIEAKYVKAEDQPEGYDPYVAKTSYQNLVSELNSNGIHAVDLSNPPDDFEYFLRGDLHWSYQGAKWSAETLSKEILKNPFFRDAKKMKFSSEIVLWLGNEKGLMERYVEKACKVTLPPERRPTWATTAVVSEASENALFEEVTYPQIAVVGTSNTANEQDFNFVGSLKKSLSVDVANYALSAAGFSGASVVFYASDEFHQHTPKIMIWEFLSHHNFDDYEGFRQMLPAIEGACDEKDAVAVSAVHIGPPAGAVTQPAGPVAAPVTTTIQGYAYGPQLPNAKKKRAIKEMFEFMIFDGLETKTINPANSYLYLEFANPEKRVLKIGVLYANGEAEQVDVSRSARNEDNGKYYLEFDSDLKDPVIMVQIETEKPQGDVKARICKYKNASL